MNIKEFMILMSVTAIVLCPIAGKASYAQSVVSSPSDRSLGIAVLPLWDEPALRSEKETSEDEPTLTVFLPQKGRGNGTAVIIAPGGRYLGLANNLEGRQIADWFTARGVTAFILKYRLGPDNPFPVPLEDAQRSIRLVRHYAKRYNLSPQHIGMVGFSAGGHLAAAAGTLFEEGNETSADPVDRLSDRPDFLILAYPWLNAMETSTSRQITYCSVIPTIPTDRCKIFEQMYTPSLHVTRETPPTFIYGTSDDAVVSVSAIVDFYKRLIATGVPAELHLFRHGAHGSGLGSGDAALDVWPSLLEQWLRDQGLLKLVPTGAGVPKNPPAPKSSKSSQDRN